ncbi:hypothetical protein LTR70_007662 [Exophiala xenobiotica]|uniref:Uncharacterized protein n=1 Tax=Lithohypha guttulata TaxID=1690604 RepID=A0ABR0K304_9EURO|nr:hypothetical protein LTR24_007931 [Lithohypha guttulata]KAK5313358.1 hypothetical protein LTR70_007662 [Exophiala xenobiotica]
MHFSPLPLLLLGAANLVLAAGQVPQIKFCNEPKLAEPCVVEDIELGQCKLIPDSNANGDEGSSMTLIGAENLACRLYDNNGCGMKHIYTIALDGYYEMTGYRVWRSYKCDDKSEI